MGSICEYLISKLSFREDCQRIDTIWAYPSDGLNLLDDGCSRTRQWLVNRFSEGCPVCALTKNDKGGWTRGSQFTYAEDRFSWGHALPTNTERHKAFVSYYHRDDQNYRELFENNIGDLIVSKSVGDGDIDSDNSDGYIKQLIQKDFLSDTTVLIVLVGHNTKHRMHVDWEISGALNLKVGKKYSGILGLLLPNHPDFGNGWVYYSNIPKRLAANVESKYAIIRDWTMDRVKIQKYIEESFANRDNDDLIVNAEIPQMTENTNE